MGSAEKVMKMAALYGFTAEKANAIDIWLTRGGWVGKNKVTRFLARQQVRSGLLRRTYVLERAPFSYDNRFEELRAPAYIDGYLINPKYFSYELGQRSFLGNLDEFADLAALIRETNSVSIHIRRGDYVNLEEYPKYGVEYVLKAIELIEERIGEGQYFVFTDDVDWVSSELKVIKRKFIIVSARTREAWDDMELMRLCKHNIISNSTFSWWGAFLNSNLDKIVIMPKVWHKQLDISLKLGLQMPGWLVI
jgi:hypothetical protein